MAEEATSLGALERAHDEAVAASAPEETPAEAKEKGTKEPETKPEVKEELKPEVKEELDDNRERSNLGRKVKILEDKLSRLDEIAAKLDRISTPKRELPPDDDAPIPMTARELREFVWKENQQLETFKAQKQREYVQGYLKHEATLGMDLSEQEYEEVIKERVANFDVRHSDNPMADADLNFHKALASVLRKKMSKGKENPLKGKKPDGPLGGPTGTENATRAAVTPKLDKDAAEFAQKMGLSAEQIQKALANG